MLCANNLRFKPGWFSKSSFEKYFGVYFFLIRHKTMHGESSSKQSLVNPCCSWNVVRATWRVDSCYLYSPPLFPQTNESLVLVGKPLLLDDVSQLKNVASTFCIRLCVLILDFRGIHVSYKSTVIKTWWVVYKNETAELWRHFRAIIGTHYTALQSFMHLHLIPVLTLKFQDLGVLVYFVASA